MTRARAARPAASADEAGPLARAGHSRTPHEQGHRKGDGERAVIPALRYRHAAAAAAAAAVATHAGHCPPLVPVAVKHTWHHGHVAEVDCERPGGAPAVLKRAAGCGRTAGFHSHSAGSASTWTNFGRSLPA